MAWTFARTEAEIIWLCERALEKDDFCRAAGERIARVLQFDGSCWQTNDPATLLITSHLTDRLPAGKFGVVAHNEYVTDDVNHFAKLATSRRRAGTLRGATRNPPAAASVTANCLLLTASTVNYGGLWSSAVRAGVG